MYNSIQHFNEYGISKIEKVIKKFISEEEDFADLVLGLEETLFELGRNILAEVLEDIDKYIKNLEVRKSEFEVVRTDPNSILTSFGNIKYNRTYYKPKKGGKHQYLTDSIVGICQHDKVSADVVINAIDEATESSYKKGGKKASYLDNISKQAVMQKIHDIEIPKQKIEVEKKRKAKILYVEADEDHVSLQSKKKQKEATKNNTKTKNNKKSGIMPKLIYVHEGYDVDKQTSNRKFLKNARYFGGVYEENEDLWLEVADYIYEQYDIENIEQIYLSGDGASWIKTGLDWIPKSKFVLDKYHLKKYINAATSHLNEDAYKNAIEDSLEWPDKEMIKEIFRKILNKTDTDKKRIVVNASRKYILNHWDGIAIRANKRNKIIGCSAEGHVSHVFSSRLSSRPKGWSKKGVSKMSKLLIFKKNGGKVYDLVLEKKKREEKEKKQQVSNELLKDLKKRGSGYENVWNNSLPAVGKGKKTGLYKVLRDKIGNCG
jgi:hypothetical protein